VNDKIRAIICEFLGTGLLVFFAVGTAAVGAQYLGTVGIALAFGFVLLGLVYAIGPISGCHVNPAVTLGALLCRRLDPLTAVGYWVAQFAGAIGGAALLYLLAHQIPGLKTSGQLGSNGYASRSAVNLSQGGAFLAETVMTFLLVYVVLAVTHRLSARGFAGLAIGLTLGVIHLLGVPLTGTSVNPARSLGPAIFAGGGALSQLWLFIVAPLVGGVLAAGAHYLTHPGPAFDPPTARAVEDPRTKVAEDPSA